MTDPTSDPCRLVGEISELVMASRDRGASWDEIALTLHYCANQAEYMREHDLMIAASAAREAMAFL